MIHTASARSAAALSLLGAALGGCTQIGAPPAPPPALASAPAGRCGDLDFPVYFTDGSDQLTPPAQAVLRSAAGRVRGCRIRSGEIVGLASAGGPAAGADALSQRRAVRVAEALASAGVPGPALTLKAGGETGATSPGGDLAPMRHAAQVFLHFAHG